MSLVRVAARIAAIQALKGNTLVGGNVLDSQIGTLDVDADGNVRTDEDKPFISVYSDAAKAEGADNHARAFVLNGDTEFLFEAGISAAHMELNEATGESTLVGIGIPSTDDAFEFHLDLVIRQIGDVLSDPDNEWSEIFRRMAHQIIRVERARLSGANNGVRLAAHQLKVTAEMIPDPVRGAELKPTHALTRFFALAATIDDEVVAAQVALMQAQLSGDEASWKTALRRFGLTRTEGDNLLLVPPEGAEEDVDISEVAAEPAAPVAGDP